MHGFIKKPMAISTIEFAGYTHYTNRSVWQKASFHYQDRVQELFPMF